MKIKNALIKNFRRLEDVEIDFDTKETVFVGPNNSGKTSATLAFRCFLDGREFRIHDFSVACLSKINTFTYENDADSHELPKIELDIWFSIDTENIEFGRAFNLIPNLSDTFDEVGVRCSFAVIDSEKLWADYIAAYPLENGSRKKQITHFLDLPQNLKKYFHREYHLLERNGEEIDASLLEKTHGKNILRNLVKVDFIDAQRNIDDYELGRSSKLSAAFASFYQKNLDHADAAEEAVQVIDENNDRLTAHYEKHFTDLMSVIKGLGVPSVHDRDLRITSALSSEAALKGSTELTYVDSDSGNELPEAYNGLGFKNLVYLAVQIRHYHLQWINTEENRPLCQIIFIEEPEVHLHAQVQQCFISNMWKILNDATPENVSVPQLIITTHSSHILDAVEFAKVRYFRRCLSAEANAGTVTTLNATKVHNLQKFQPEQFVEDGVTISPEKSLLFLKRYLRLTHCDLFFADAAIMVEGTVEKLLLPKMIDKVADGLNSKYLTILEIGGAYAHRFASLLDFLDIPYIVITDIDSAEPTGRHKACRTDVSDAVTSNAALKSFFNIDTIAGLSAVTMVQKEQSNGLRYVTFQKPVDVQLKTNQHSLHARTLEEAFIYENYQIIESGDLAIKISLPTNEDEIFEYVYKTVKSSSFKKTQFALDVLISSADWIVPSYIEESLVWLNTRLSEVDSTRTQE
uniref:ATP-dependent endonuclease n=1 Tax=OCS116 cluster bacterium TaxID=2030921 RepID=A0A2A4Z2F7_9PROT